VIVIDECHQSGGRSRGCRQLSSNLCVISPP
jgi:hypothetical protein